MVDRLCYEHLGSHKLIGPLGLGASLTFKCADTHPTSSKADGQPLCSRHRGHTHRGQDSLGRRKLTRQRRDAKMPLHPPARRPHGHRRNGSEAQTEATTQDTGRLSCPRRVGAAVCPIQGLGHRAARRPRRGVGTTSASRAPRPGALMPATRNRPRFIHYRVQPPRTHVSFKRPKRSRTHQSHTKVPGEYRGALGLVTHTLKSGPPGNASQRKEIRLILDQAQPANQAGSERS